MMDQAELDDEDAIEIGRKIVEAADRLKVMHAVAPGAVAKWAFEMDDVRYEVAISVAKTQDVPK